MDICNSFHAALVSFYCRDNRTTAESFRQLIAGWVCASRRTSLGGMRTTQPTQCHSDYQRVFASARWTIAREGLTMFKLIVQLTDQSTRYLVGDDTWSPSGDARFKAAARSADRAAQRRAW